LYRRARDIALKSDPVLERAPANANPWNGRKLRPKRHIPQCDASFVERALTLPPPAASASVGAFWGGWRSASERVEPLAQLAQQPLDALDGRRRPLLGPVAVGGADAVSETRSEVVFHADTVVATKRGRKLSRRCWGRDAADRSSSAVQTHTAGRSGRPRDDDPAP